MNDDAQWRDKLSAEESRVLALWPEDVTNAELKAAVGRIRYQQGLSNRFRQGLVRSGRWRDYIEREFSALGVEILGQADFERLIGDGV